MATTKTTEEKFSGTGSQTVFPFTIEYLATSDLRVFVNNAIQTETTHYSISGSNLTFVTAPSSGTGNVKISRSTKIDKARAVYAAGSSVRAVDLNANQDQTLFALQERYAAADTIVSDTDPNNPASGDRWYDSVSGRTYVYYEDVDSSQWVEANPPYEATSAPQITSISDTQVVSNAAINSTKLSFTQTGTGAVARTVDDRLKEFVSVKDFGAVGDGVADDTAAIQAAINTNKSVGFPTGRYKVTDTITIPNTHVGQILYTLNGNGVTPSVALKPNAEIIGTLSNGSDLASAKPMFLVQASGVKFEGLYLNNTDYTNNAIGIKVEVTVTGQKDDADGNYAHCMLGNWKYGIYHIGRGIGVNDCIIFTSDTGILLDWPSSVSSSQGGIAIDDDYANRGTQIKDNFFHGVVTCVQHIGSLPLVGALITGNHLDIGQTLFAVGDNTDGGGAETRDTVITGNVVMFSAAGAAVQYYRDSKSIRDHIINNHFSGGINTEGGSTEGVAADRTPLYQVYFRSCHTIEDLTISNNYFAYAGRHTVAFLNEDSEAAATATGITINNNTFVAWGFDSTNRAARGGIAMEIPTTNLSIRNNTFKNTYSTTECIRFSNTTQTNLHIDSNTLTAGALYVPTNLTFAGNKLDSSYSTGTFTPTLGNVSAPTYVSQTGNYIKIGQLVHVWINIEMNSLDTSDTSGVTIAGLPFPHDIDQAVLGLDAFVSTGLGNKGNITGATFTGATSVTLTDATSVYTYADSGDAAGIIALAFIYKSSY